MALPLNIFSNSVFSKASPYWPADDATIRRYAIQGVVLGAALPLGSFLVLLLLMRFTENSVGQVVVGMIFFIIVAAVWTAKAISEFAPKFRTLPPSEAQTLEAVMNSEKEIAEFVKRIAHVRKLRMGDMDGVQEILQQKIKAEQKATLERIQSSSTQTYS